MKLEGSPINKVEQVKFSCRCPKNRKVIWLNIVDSFQDAVSDKN